MLNLPTTWGAVSATRKTPARKDKYTQTLTQETTDQLTDSSPSKKTRMSWSQEKIKKRKKYCDNLPLVGIERCEAHDKKRQDEKDKDESPECVNNTHGQRDGQGACKKNEKGHFFTFFLPGWSSQALSMDSTIVISSLRISLPFLRRPHLPDFQLGPTRILILTWGLNGFRHTL